MVGSHSLLWGGCKAKYGAMLKQCDTVMHCGFFAELLKLRNSLVHHINHFVEKGADRSRLSRLPDILTSRQTCQYCPQKLNCALYER